MKNIFFIIILCYFMYKTGVIKNLLNRFKLADAEPAKTTPARYQAPPEGREKWENEAYYILTQQGYTYPETVKYMGDEMLINIIREYLDY